MAIERTFSIIKPDAVARNSIGDIFSRFEKAGLRIVAARMMRLTQARRAARIAPDGSIVRLPDQDRALWDRALIDEGQQIVRACIRRDQPGPYQLQAAIAAVHSDAATPLDTDWVQVLALYDHLLVIAPSSVVELNRAIALAEVQGPEPALRVVNGLGLDDYHLLHAVRADLLHRLGHDDESRAAYDAAIALTTNPAERDLLIRRRP